MTAYGEPAWTPVGRKSGGFPIKNGAFVVWPVMHVGVG
jgi:hypothetical protein